ncbi:2-haloalkanoic acid dehalogenase [Arcticibacter svalbardensis MN12-7]|uniref:2-haloalkanoic acid dehalogenase n=1 Tax=Arcticibacter svalbardensis MN12-7 TaxID=1150600 RepID=R9GX23_9SPHI|nr:haloacid dehalogenase type II [Arcticibacter svalbardensis]EOR93514.1 2-haloalkanoic acid dehalogenase [Arcticibacter svalbardensis MN12-7]
MKNSRRSFVKKAIMAGVGGLTISNVSFGADFLAPEIKFKNIKMMKAPKVLFFDVNETLLDLGNMKKSVAKALGRDDLLSLWFTTMLQYSLVSTTSRQYADFGAIGAATLRMVAANHGIELSAEKAKEALIPLSSLPPHPEVKEALKNLKNADYKMVSLTNSSNRGVETQFKNAGLTDLFDERLSIEDIGKYKPASDVYDWAARKMGVQPNECMMIAAHGWDVAGAIWAGWRAAFIARPGQQLYPLAPVPEINEKDLLSISEKLIALKS